MRTEPGQPMTLGNAATNHVRIIIWCRACQHQVEPDPAVMAARYGAPTRRCSISVSGWCAPGAAAEIS